MGIENPVHLLFIAIVALVVLGPKRLPELARALGHGIREFREAVSQQGEQPVVQQPFQASPAQQPFQATPAQAPFQAPPAQQPVAGAAPAPPAPFPPAPGPDPAPPAPDPIPPAPTPAPPDPTPPQPPLDPTQPARPTVTDESPSQAAASLGADDPTEAIRSGHAPDRRPL